MRNTEYPRDYVVDITGFCNLRCRFCPEGKRINEQPQRSISFEEFMKISSSFLPYAKNIMLGNWSEPFLNEDILKIIEYIKARGEEISIQVNTNGNYFTQDHARNLVKLGLDRIVISMSGIKNDIYKRYHVGGDIDKLFRTLTYITNAKEIYKSSLPYIEIVYLLFPFNYNSLRYVKRFLRKKLGFDKFRQINYVRLNYGYFAGTDLNLEQIIKIYGKNLEVYKYPLYLKQYCNRAHNNPAIRADGTVFPCCAITYNSKYALGNLKVNNFDEIWNSQGYQRFRETFDEGTNQLCENCTWYFPDHKIKIDRSLLYRIKGKLWLIKSIRFGK